MGMDEFAQGDDLASRPDQPEDDVHDRHAHDWPDDAVDLDVAADDPRADDDHTPVRYVDYEYGVDGDVPVYYYDYALDDVIAQEPPLADDDLIVTTWVPSGLRRLWLRWHFAVPAVLVVLAGVATLAILYALGSGSEGSPPVVITSTPVETPLQTGAWPPDATFVPHTVPARIRNDLDRSGVRHGYLFYGQVGQSWCLSVIPLADSALDPLVSVYAPNGALLRSVDDRAPDDRSSEITLVLSDDGAYRVLVESAKESATTGSYLLTLENLCASVALLR